VGKRQLMSWMRRGCTNVSGYQPDILAKDLTVIFCGLNPGMTAETSGHSFSTPSNRFWTVLHLAGFTDVRLEPKGEHRLLNYRCGIAVVVRRATRRASEIPLQELREARPEFENRMRRLAPRSLAFLGKRAYAAMMGVEDVHWGRQPEMFASIATWILPNPSGLNRSFTLGALVRAYSELRIALES
jgi:TDG/mug DNA glycosylase family protein